MKQIKFLVLGLIVIPMLLQSCASGLTANIRKAGTSLETGDLAEAKVLIDSAVVDSVAQQDPKAWMTYGDVYLAIATDSTNSVDAENPLLKAYQGYSRVVEMEDTASLLGVQANQQIEQVWANAINNGASLYSAQNYDEAIKLFDVAKMAMPDDTTAYIYGGISAQQAGNLEAAAEDYAFLVDSLDYESKDFYNSLIYIYLVENKNEEKALDYLQKAQVAFPDDPEFLKREITMLINNEKYDEAEQKLTKAIDAEPDNPMLYYNQGYLYEQMGKGEQAVESYKKSIEQDAQYFDANFNLAAYYYNEAAEILAEANNMELKEYQEKGEEIEKQAKEYFEKALPYLETSQMLEPDNQKVLSTLSTIYQQLGMNEKAEEIDTKLESM
ncbi:tetratricopeptide repeat protein [Tunicatimonas pelagia]|uniref:tetratricopeptide repeat protein n=1 Tax=Tunicatimonas pelagia TaxID=931531 RepID=UPI002666C448|nr:tetratricopeptide repeat protein [Tunicatimonas pelagia]WKN43530.1 tetratricopeptide repeat protein [Tunicatimonas pelagia]